MTYQIKKTPEQRDSFIVMARIKSSTIFYRIPTQKTISLTVINIHYI